MNQADYERRKQYIEQELEATIELVRAGARAQLRALDMVWMTSPENSAPVPVFLDPPSAPRPAPLLLAPVEAAPAAPAAPVRKRRPAAELYYEVCDALEKVPEVFDRTDLLALLETRPERSSLYRVLEDIRRQGRIEVVEKGRGIHPDTYRRKSSSQAEPTEE